MATISDSRSGGGGRSPIRRRRRRPPPKTRHWFADVFIRPARALASTAGSILTAVFSESEESSSDWDGECDSDECDSDSVSGHGTDLKMKKGPFPDISQKGQESEFIVSKTENKQLIEQLIMQESFSRDEYTGLIEVLNSRVTDSSTKAGAKASIVKTADHEDAHKSTQAAQESQKWFPENQMRSTPVTELEPARAGKVASALVDPHSTKINGTPLIDLAESRPILYVNGFSSSQAM
ncbi:ATP-dependent Clp protease ATP-binding subunit ClpX [Striga asiatica]|uniref:ATP-dependent Clp protease ATP-binding subunit ClpX n=1 Tax=Striga asiatica TaxID=4170 RepID=A0A5A7P5V6_STRAF|nr:ATP-dependent Clp protease ATP-binding subunit ClpX [Striga asiatica]